MQRNEEKIEQQIIVHRHARWKIRNRKNKEGVLSY